MITISVEEVEIIWGIKASWTTEIGAAGAYHQTHGVYLAEIYGCLAAGWRWSIRGWGCPGVTLENDMYIIYLICIIYLVVSQNRS